jgi:hypothetical protein
MRLRERSARPLVELDEGRLHTSGSPPDTALTIEQALHALPPNLRAVLVLKEIEGFTHAEIAAMLDISVGASEVRLHRALLVDPNERFPQDEETWYSGDKKGASAACAMALEVDGRETRALEWRRRL